jgi:hypothetical protein
MLCNRSEHRTTKKGMMCYTFLASGPTMMWSMHNAWQVSKYHSHVVITTTIVSLCAFFWPIYMWVVGKKRRASPDGLSH